jgi:outer membrane lipoprotein-sorting protein
MNLKRSILFPCLSPIVLAPLLACLLVSIGAFAQSADDAIARYVEALGGKDKVQSIKSIYQEGVAVMQNGNEIETKTWRVQGKLYRQEVSFGMGNLIIIVTPKQGWISNPRNGGAFTAMSEDQLKNTQAQMDCSGPLVDYAAKGNKAEFLGEDTVKGNKCYKVKLTLLSLASAPVITYFIDEKTGYVLREIHKGGNPFGGGGGRAGANSGAGANAEFNIDFGDYQKTPDGYVFPFTITTSSFGAKTSVEKIEVNKEVDEAALSKPSK